MDIVFGPETYSECDEDFRLEAEWLYRCHENQKRREALTTLVTRSTKMRDNERRTAIANIADIIPSARTVGTTSTDNKPASSAGAEGDKENRPMEAITLSPEAMDPVESFDGCAKDEGPTVDTAVTTPPIIESKERIQVRLADDDSTSELVVQQLETSRKEVQVRLAQNDLLTTEPVAQELESGSEKENLEVDKTKKPVGRCAQFGTIFFKVLLIAAVASVIVMVVFHYKNNSAEDTFAQDSELDQLQSKCKQSTVPASSWFSLKSVETKTEKVMLAQVHAGQQALKDMCQTMENVLLKSAIFK